jgi:saccharopepsin
VCRNASVFDTDASSTFLASDIPVYFSSGWLWGRGNLSYDTIGYGGVAAEHQAVAIPNFLWSDSYIFNACPMAGVIGLAPFHSRTAKDDFGKPSPFITMVHQNALENNLFALRLREPAELSFGRVNHTLFQGDFLAKVPLTRNLSGIWDGGWQTTASYLALDEWDANKSFRSDLGDVPATFSTRSPTIHLPEPVYDRVFAASGCASVNGPWLPPAVDCSARFGMPNITFNFAGQNLTLTAFDYTIPWYLEPEMPDCTCMFTTSSGFDWSNEVVLGWAFMRKFYSVFDLDNGSIGCKLRTCGRGVMEIADRLVAALS